MRYVVTIGRYEESDGDNAIPRRVFEQEVDDLDMRAVFAAINKRPRKSRAKSKQDEKQ